MAANIEQIFQDFILNKIREIEDQNDDNTVPEGPTNCAAMAAAEKSSVDTDAKEESRESVSQKKHKKHKKHKSKKKKKKKDRGKDMKESNSESGAELDHRSKHQSRRGMLTGEKKQGEDEQSASRGCKHSAPKKKKKKRKRKDEGKANSSDSDSESSSRRGGSKCGQKSSPRRREDLPDIIPKQDSSNAVKVEESRPSRRSRCSRSRSRSHSHCRSHSCSLRTEARHQQTVSGTRSPSRAPGVEASAESSQVRGSLDPPAQSPSRELQLASSLLADGIPVVEPSAEQRLRAENPEQRSNQLSIEAQLSQLKQTASSGPGPSTGPSPPRSSSAKAHKPAEHKRRKASKSPSRDKEKKSSKRQKRSRTPCQSRRTGSRSRSPSRKRRSRSRSRGRRSRRSRSRSASRGHRRAAYSQRDRWKREPSRSPVLILRKKRSPPRKHSGPEGSPQRISDLDKEQLLEIAKANAAAMCAKAGMPIPASLRSSALPMALPSMAMNAAMASMTAATMTAALSNMGTLSSLLPLPSITNKPPPLPAQPNMAALEEVKRKVAKQADSISIKEFTEKCKMIVDSKGELPVAVPHVSDEEDDGKPFGAAALREQKAISFNLNSAPVRPAVRSDAGMAKEFPVSSGSQHRKKEGEAQGAYGEWVPVEKAGDEAAAALRRALSSAPAAASSPSADSCTAAAPVVAPEPPAHDSVFPDPPPQPVDISQAVTERIKAQRRLAENPYDVSAICMLSRAQEQVDAWAQSNTVPGLFTGSTGAQVLSSEELSTSGPQAWLKKDQFLRAAPVSGGVGEFLMRKMGWRTGEGLGRNREGTVEPIIIDFKVDRKGLVAEGEKLQKQTGGLVVTKDLMGKHPVSALIELCNKRRIMQPDFVMVHHSGPDHRKNFLFKVTVNGVDYQPQTASPNKKHAKAMAATVALQALGEVPADGPGLYTGPVFTAASTGPLFST